ncbi:MAG: translocation/assembly module TamB domain-containing protein, partial [Sphingomonadaceae bacterium]
SFEGPRLAITRLSGTTNGGTITGGGSILLAAEGAGEIDLAIQLERARLANSPLVRMTASGPLTLKGSLAQATLAGRLDIDSGEIQVGQVAPTAAATVPVRRRGAPTPVATAQAGSSLRFDLRVVAADSVKVDGLGLDSFWGADIRVTGDLANPRLTGQAVAARGVYDFAGRSFNISRGRIGFVGDPWESTLDILATSRGEGFEAGVLIAGTARRPELGFTSIPPLPEDEVLARLLFGTSVADLSLPEAVQLGAALASLRGGGGGLDPIGGIRRATGIDRIRITGADAETGLGTAVAIGERIGRNLYVEVATDTTGNALTTLQYTLTRILSVLVQVNTLGDASVNLRYARDY